jgi:hypothetical protein
VSFGELLEQSDYLVIQAPGRRLDRRAGIDDLDEEPAKRRDWKPSGPLFTLPNLIVTLHAAYCSDEAIGTVRDFPRARSSGS